MEVDEVAERALRFYQRPIKRRYLIASLAFFGFCIIYMLRVNLSVAIVAMTANKTRTLENGTTITVSRIKYTAGQVGNMVNKLLWSQICSYITKLIGYLVIRKVVTFASFLLDLSGVIS